MHQLVSFRFMNSEHFNFFIIEVNASYIMALVGVELQTLVSEPDALTTRPHPELNSNY